MKNSFFFILGLIIILGSIFLFFQRALEENQTKTIRINDVEIEVEIADTSAVRELGLSNRETLLDGTGMLFVFDNSSQYGIWMKNMNFSIDIAWIDEELQVIGIEKDVTPETFPQIFYPKSAIKYALELPAGTLDKYRIDIGGIVSWKE